MSDARWGRTFVRSSEGQDQRAVRLDAEDGAHRHGFQNRGSRAAESARRQPPRSGWFGKQGWVCPAWPQQGQPGL